MSEPKKVPLTTVSNDKDKVKCKKECKTIRFTLSLTESNENSCSEFNYGELLTEHFHKKFAVNRPETEVINGPNLHPNDPFNRQDTTALKALAKQFETKYGTSITGKKKKKKSTDFKSLGQGYDETDPFIDNSDALDDVVPKNVDTKYGGFYINAGELDFHQVELSDEDSQAINIKRKKRKIVDSSDNDDDDKSSKNGKLNGHVDKYDEAEIHRRRKKLINKFNAKKHKLRQEDDEESDNNKAKPPSGSFIDTSIAASIEAVINKVRGDPGSKEKAENDQNEGTEIDDELIKESTTTASSSSSSSSSESSSSESESENEENEDESIKTVDNQLNNLSYPDRCSSPESDEAVPLPNNLPPDLITVLDKIKEVGRNSRGSSQKFFTDPAVNKMLLSIEIKLNKLGGSRKKTQIYKHLAGHLPCGMQTIVKRGKNLLSERLEGRLNNPMNRLKEAIASTMPALMESYAIECQRSTEQKIETELEGSDGEKKSKTNLPKKKFPFTDDFIAKLCEVVKVKCQGWYMIKKRNEDPQEHVKSFLEESVKTLWPKGWVSTKLLYKISIPAHNFVTHKKPVEPPVENNTPPVIQSNQNGKPNLTYEPVKLSHDLEKIVNETTKMNSERIVSSEIKDSAIIEVPGQIQTDKKNEINATYLNKHIIPDPITVAIKEQLSKTPTENVKPPKNEESIMRECDSSKSNVDIKPVSNSLPKFKIIDESHLERRPPKPCLSATVLPKVSITSRNKPDTKEEERNTITCITVKSVDKINEATAKNQKDVNLKKPNDIKTTVQSSSNIIDLSLVKNKAESSQLQNSSSDRRPDGSNSQVVNLSVKPVIKNDKLEKEIDNVMSELLEMSRTLQNTPSPKQQSEPTKDLTPPNRCTETKVDKNPKPIQLTKMNSEPNHSTVITSTTKPIKTFPTDYSPTFKYSKPSQVINESSSIYRKCTTSQDVPYKPKTAFQESYLAQRYPPKIISNPVIATISPTIPVTQSSPIQNASITVSSKSFTANNNIPASTQASSIQHANSNKSVSSSKNIAEISILRPNVGLPQRQGGKIYMQPSETINRLPYNLSMHQVSNSTHVESLSRPVIIKSSQANKPTSNISVNFNPTPIVHSKPHSLNHFPTNHSIQSLAQSSHRYDGSTQPKIHSNQGNVDQYMNKRNHNDRQMHKGNSSDPLANLRLMQGLSVSSIPKKTSVQPATSNNSQSTNLATSSTHKIVSPVTDPKGKPGSESYRKVPAQPVFSNLSAEQMESLRSSSQHQQEFWKHINANGYFTGLSPNDAIRYMNQGGQYTGNGSGSSKQGQY